MEKKMNGGQATGQDLQRAVQTPAPALRGAGQATRAEKQGELANFLDRLQKSNARFNELILMQRDAAIRIAGVNPVEEPQPTDTPELVGITSEINAELIRYDELNQKLNQLTDRWLQL